MEAIQREWGGPDGPGDYILPVRYASSSAAGTPELVEWWQWMPAESGSVRSRWVLVTQCGDG